jgi:membrane protease subunit HflC
MIKIILGVIIVGGLIVFSQAAYKVDETESVVITRFGEIQESTSSPGLHFKAPFVDSVVRFNSRVLRVDVEPATLPDVDSQFLEIDAYVRYEIADVKQYRVTLLDERQAQGRISQIVIAALREEVGKRTREDIVGGDIVRGTTLIDGVEVDSVSVIPRMVINNAGISVGTREELTRVVTALVQKRAEGQAFGIRVIDVRIKRADFPDSIVESIYTRMRSERAIQANRLRAEGEEQFLTKTADVNRRVQIIGAEADRDASRLRGDGEAQAIAILASALEQDRDFFTFRRSLEAYSAFLRSNTTVVLPADSALFQFLQSPEGNR